RSPMPCPLCNEPRHRPSWLGTMTYRGRDFPYAECLGCGSLYCEAMPDTATVALMYGPSYETAFAPDPAIVDPKRPEQVVHWLERNGRGVFLDYGCGAGALLTEARRLGWDAVGVEFDAEVATEVGRRTGARTLTAAQAERLGAPMADVLHLG